MPTNFPAAKDTTANLPTAADLADDNLDTKPHSTLHGDLGLAVIALETKVGIDSSADATSLDYKIVHIAGSQITSGTVQAARLPSLDAITAPAADVSFNSHKGTNVANGTNPNDVVNKSQLDVLIAAADAMVYKGAIDCSANPNYPAADAGATYKVSVAGKIGGASGLNVEVGDTLLCTADGTVSGNQATVGAFWNIVQANLDGAVIGPASSTDGNIVLFNGASGKLVKDGGLPSQFQTHDTDLDTIAALDSATAGALVTDGAGWIRKTYAQLKTALGLGNVDNVADASKTFAATQITSGQFAMARLASGTPTGSKFVRDDGTLQVPTAPTDPTLAILQRQQFK